MHRLAKFIGSFIYFFVLITSFYHVFKFYEIFETESESFVAFFVSVGFELSILYFAYIFTKYKFQAAKHALILSLFIVWFGNIFVMAINVHSKTFQIGVLNSDWIKFALAALGSVFLPVCSFYLGKILANIDMLQEDKEVEYIGKEIGKDIVELNEIDKEIKEMGAETIGKINDIYHLTPADAMPTIDIFHEPECPAAEIKIEISAIAETVPSEVVTEVSAVAETVPQEVITNVSAAAPAPIQEIKTIIEAVAEAPIKVAQVDKVEDLIKYPPYIAADKVEPVVVPMVAPTTNLKKKLSKLLG